MRVFGLLFCFLSLPLFAGTQLTTQIYDIDYGKTAQDEILIFLTSGNVVKVKREDQALLKKFTAEKSARRWFTFTMDDDRFVVKMDPSETPPLPPEEDEKFFTPMNTTSEYVPTTIKDMDTAKKYFKEARYNPKDSQCFNRAMVWSYEWWRKHSLKSNKILIFFTRTYIRRYNFEWWFHIAPYVHIKDGDKVVERVMDVKYSRGPIEFTKWTNIFMRNDAPCPVITKYSEYADFPYTGECYIIRTHMYTYQPADLQMYDSWGYQKDKFNMDEVRGAYLEAFDERI
ncbi:protein-glutamine glutaminase family protein [Peredibacter starrii]|uniref:Protein-glutamine glutaminase family protein n=1 Tax=Peredibacter starrii TaxID=28202 RepID=A0AAX4HUL0_9BACT|nr:protein-glutamine glutaminase family protein [Peredibacter starrii]WPU66911.1 protein-glutamine glutaminase family protein [Peredibacter starrii]